MSKATDGGAPIRALLFDLGGVVIEIDWRRVFRIWADHDRSDPAELERRFSFDKAYEQHETGELDAEGYFAALRQTLGLRLSGEEIVSGWNDIYVGLVPGMKDLLSAAAQRFPLYAFTNSNPTHQSAWTERFASELSVFCSVFVSSELGLRKPDPEAFRVVAGRTGFRVSEILFFDDVPANVDGARTAGMQAVLVKSSADVREALERLGVRAPGPGASPGAGPGAGPGTPPGEPHS